MNDPVLVIGRIEGRFRNVYCMTEKPARQSYFIQTGKLIALVFSFCFLFICLTWLQITNQLANDKQQIINAAVQRNSNLAVSLEQYAIRTIRNADAVVQLVIHEYNEKGSNIDFTSLFNKGIIDPANFNGVAIIDDKGKLRQTNLDSFLNRDFSDRAYFQFHKKFKDSLYISHPLLSRTIGRTVIVVSRRLEHVDGSFAGVVALQIEPSTFTRFYSKADLDEHDIISLISPTGITYARRTGNIESSGENIIKSPLFRHLERSPVDTYFAGDAIRGIPTYFSYRRLENYPVIATVGSSEEGILSTFYPRAIREYIFGSVVSALLILFSFLICRFFIERIRNTRTIKNKEARYRSIFENTQDAILLVKESGELEAINEAAYRLFKIERSQAKLSTADLFYCARPDFQFDPETFNRLLQAKTEVSFTLLDETEFVGEIVCSLYHDAEGKVKYLVLVRDVTERKLMEKQLLIEQKRYQRKLTKQIILAQEREREVIGHELHDNVNQILTTVKLFLEMARHHEDMREELLPKSIYHIQECIHEIRNLSHELSAPTLGTQSLVDSIKALIETLEASARFKICFHYDQYHSALEKDKMLAIYRILQEQLNNIIKHANATEIFICLSQSDGETRFIVRDNGDGFDMTAGRGGIGFNNMRSRAKVFGGKMHVYSAPGKGCEVQITIPCTICEGTV